jgi:hypothetical protein
MNTVKQDLLLDSLDDWYSSISILDIMSLREGSISAIRLTAEFCILIHLHPGGTGSLQFWIYFLKVSLLQPDLNY